MRVRRLPPFLSVPLLAALLGAAVPAARAAPGVQVRMDQLGFLPGARKLVVAEGGAPRAFEVEREDG